MWVPLMVLLCVAFFAGQRLGGTLGWVLVASALIPTALLLAPSDARAAVAVLVGLVAFGISGLEKC